MILTDVNVLVYAHRQDTAEHASLLAWLEGLLNGDQAYGYADQVLAGFIRVVTHPRIFSPPSSREAALAFAHAVRSQPNAVPIQPGARHWEIFSGLCQASGARGNLIPDAFLAALAIESGSEWVTTDRDYSRFPGLRWRHPLSR